jgi:hypothetical protein
MLELLSINRRFGKMRFPKFPIVFVFRFRPMQQPHFRVHSYLNIYSVVFICKKQIARIVGNSFFPRHFLSRRIPASHFQGKGKVRHFFRNNEFLCVICSTAFSFS